MYVNINIENKNKKMSDPIGPTIDSFMEIIALLFWTVTTLGPCILYFKNNMNLTDNDRELLETKIILNEQKLSNMESTVAIIENIQIGRKIDRALDVVDHKAEVLADRIGLVENQVDMIKQVEGLNFFDSLLIINSLFLWGITLSLIIFCSFYYILWANKKIQIIIS